MIIRLITRTAFAATLLLLTASPLRAQLFMEEIVVFAVDTVPKQSVTLQIGKSYDIICSDTFTFWDNIDGDSVGLVDAAYYRAIPPGEFGFAGLATSATNGFLIDGAPIATRISPSGMSPTYTYRVPYVGQGRPAEVFIEDHPPFSVDRHYDNSGAIRVRIYNVSPEIAIDSAAIDFGEVELGDWRDTVIVFENIGYGPLVLTDFLLGGSEAPEFILSGSDRYTLAPGERDSVTVRFQPQSVFRKTAFLMFNSNDSDSPVITIPLSGIGVTTLEAGCMSTLTAPSQAYSNLPVTLFTNREGSRTTSYAFDLSYDETLLIPDRVETAGTLSESFDVDMTVVQPGLLRISASNGQPLTGTGTLLFIRIFAAWDTPSVSPLDVENLVFNASDLSNAGNPRARIVDGAVEIDSLCNQYLKNVIAVGLPRLGPNRPNPFNPVTTIEWSLPADQHVRISVHDAMGREVAVLVDGPRSSGTHSSVLNAASLPSGSYFVRMRSAAGTLHRRILLLR
ncbi:MAG: choice-of-anchor D domain-containing protein [Bacteroidota bacterium]|nr:choice-of-anchor D domain-containing protein [Bacteroidota bacterium]